MDAINKLIAADDLYWNDSDNKYAALSESEIQVILAGAYENGIEKESDLCQILEWATLARVGGLLLKNLLDNKIKIIGIDKDNEPLFGPNI